jgi:coproporphyrinogen III oxidase-like Fe-S oxidoreductase
MVAGWPYQDFRDVTGFDLREHWAGEMQQLCERGWARADGRRFQLTRQGLRFADSAAELFLR